VSKKYLQPLPKETQIILYTHATAFLLLYPVIKKQVSFPLRALTIMKTKQFHTVCLANITHPKETKWEFYKGLGSGEGTLKMSFEMFLLNIL
jgi:hypothetical protein